MKAWLFRFAFIMSLLAALLAGAWWIWRDFFSAEQFYGAAREGTEKHDFHRAELLKKLGADTRPWREDVRYRMQMTVSFDFQDMDLEEVFAFLSSYSGIDISFDPENIAGKRGPCLIEGMSLESAVSWVCTLNDLSWGITDYGVYVSTKEKVIEKAGIEWVKRHDFGHGSEWRRNIAMQMGRRKAICFPENMPIREILRLLRCNGHCSIVFTPAVAEIGTLRFQVKGSTCQEALDCLIKECRLRSIMVDEALFIGTPEEVEKIIASGV